MKIIRDAFSGIDFTDSNVQILFGVITLLIFLIVFVIFVVFKLFIPKSKIQDEKTISKAIVRLKILIRIEKIILLASAVVAIVLLILHFTKITDVFQPPLIWVGIIDVAIIPIALVAVFGSRGLSSNQAKLNELRQRKEDIRLNRPKI